MHISNLLVYNNVMHISNLLVYNNVMHLSNLLVYNNAMHISNLIVYIIMSLCIIRTHDSVCKCKDSVKDEKMKKMFYNKGSATLPIGVNYLENLCREI